MEVGGHTTAKESAKQENLQQKSGNKYALNHFLRVPTEKPPFTLNQLKKVIPPHCFDRSILRSFSYLIKDLIIAIVLSYIALTLFPIIPSPFHLIAWPLYWFAQGMILSGVWVIAHECGHNAFSKFPFLDNFVGFVLHTFLLTPFFSWKYSHRRHHSNTGSIERDEAICAKTRSSITWLAAMPVTPFGCFLRLVIFLPLAWPLYLFFNLYGRPYERHASHFDPYSPIYNNQERAQIIISDVGIITMLYILYHLASAFTISCVFRIYIVPLLIVNTSLIFVTCLHHTHLALPRYDSSEWDWLRGSLSTVDRSYGFLNAISHNIGDTHVLHHIFSTIPHYHATEATNAIRPVLGDYYLVDNTPLYKAIWRESRECIFVEADLDKGKPKGVLWFRNHF